MGDATDDGVESGPRPTTYTPALLAEICTRLSTDESLVQIARDPRMPQVDTMLRWQQSDTVFAQEYALALERLCEYLMHRIKQVEIRMMRGYTGSAEGRAVIQSIQWRMERLAAKRYGARVAAPGGNAASLEALVMASMVGGAAGAAFARAASGPVTIEHEPDRAA